MASVPKLRIPQPSRMLRRGHISYETVGDTSPAYLANRDEHFSYIRQGIAHIGGTSIKFTFEQPLEAQDSVPLLLVPGYGGIKPAYRELRKAVVAEGKPAVTFKPPRTQERFAG